MMNNMPGRFPPPPDTRPENQPPGGAPPGQASIYPLDMGRVMSLTFSLFRFRWRAFIAASVLVMLPAFILIALANVLVGDELARAQQAQLDLAYGRPIDLEEVFPWGALLVSFVGVVVVALVGFVAQAAVVELAARTYDGQRIGARQAVGAALRRLATLAALAIIIQLAVFGIMLVGVTIGVLLIFGTAGGGAVEPGLGAFIGLIIMVATFAAVVFVIVRWTFAVQGAMLEGAGALGSLGLSWRLVGGSSWRVLGYLLLFGLLVGIAGAILGTALGLLTGAGFAITDGTVRFDPGGFLVASLLSGLVSAAIQPIFYIGLTLLYFDIRVRRGEPPLARREETA